MRDEKTGLSMTDFIREQECQRSGRRKKREYYLTTDPADT